MEPSTVIMVNRAIRKWICNRIPRPIDWQELLSGFRFADWVPAVYTSDHAKDRSLREVSV